MEGLEVTTRPDRVSRDEVNSDINNLVPARGRSFVRVIVLVAVVNVHVEEGLVLVHQLELLKVGDRQRYWWTTLMVDHQFVCSALILDGRNCREE